MTKRKQTLFIVLGVLAGVAVIGGIVAAIVTSSSI